MKRNRYRFILLSVAITVILLSLSMIGCKRPGMEEMGRHEESELIIPQSTKIFEGDDIEAITSVSQDFSTLTFDPSSDLVGNLETGDVLVLGRSNLTPEGLLRKIEDINTNGSEVTVTTTQAALDEAEKS
jgi:hypothetical protein